MRKVIRLSKSFRKSNELFRFFLRGGDVATVLRELNITEATYYRWRNHYGGLKAEDVKKVKKLEKMNLQLKKLRPKAELKKRSSSSRLRETFRPDKSVAGRVWRHQHVRYQ